MNPLRAALDAGRVPLGGWCTFAGAASAEVLAASGLDWVLVDLQHGTLTVGDLADVVRAVEVAGAAPAVRVAANDPAQVMKALDLGAVAVVVPLVESAEEAARAASAMRYPPLGTRSFGPGRPPGHPSREDQAPLCLPMIETARGLDAVEAIAAVPGVDGLFVGAVDLALSLGLPGGGAPELTAAVRRVVGAAREHGLVTVAVASDEDHAAELVRLGVGVLLVVADKAALGSAVADVIAAVDTTLLAAAPVVAELTKEEA